MLGIESCLKNGRLEHRRQRPDGNLRKKFCFIQRKGILSSIHTAASSARAAPSPGAPVGCRAG